MKNRSGSYKKILLTSEDLAKNELYLQENIQALKDQSLSCEDFTTLYILLFLRIKHQKNYLQKKGSLNYSTKQIKLLEIIPKSFKLDSWEHQKLQGVCGMELFSCFNLKSIPLSINRTMVHWYQKKWAIQRLEHIPSPKELLALQLQNSRCLTTIVEPKRIAQLVFNIRDPLSFVLHDLMHADQFFNSPEKAKGQLGFYQLLNSLYEQDDIIIWLKEDEQFRKEFEYVSSDMNAYVIHLFKCLKSAFIRKERSSQSFMRILEQWKMSENEKNASDRLNTPMFNMEDEMLLKKFFENNQGIYL